MVWRILFMSSSQRELERLGAKEFEYLSTAFGFSKPKYEREWYQTAIYFLNKSLAIEIQLDWRDRGVFFLVVALEEGRLPEGYYVSKGKTCRIHLMTLLEDKKWIEPDEVEPFMGESAKLPQTPEAMKEDIRRYSALLKDKMPLILANRETLFDEADKRRAEAD
jgi:hypothetical protein